MVTTGIEPLPAAEQVLLRDVWVVAAPHQPPRRRDVLLDGPRIGDWSTPGGLAVGEATPVVAAADLWLGPSLVDPHSHLEEAHGLVDNLSRLAEEALRGGYGAVALSPQATPWRDRPQELITGRHHGLELLSWGSFSAGGAGQNFSDHGALLAAGAVGLAEESCHGHPQLLFRGLQWQADAHRRGEGSPLAVAPRDPRLQAGGMAREGAAALRLGLPTDPVASELLPLQQLLQAAGLVDGATGLRLLNVSTAAAVACLQRHPHPMAAAVHWWHLVEDTSGLGRLSDSWRVQPSLGSRRDRQALLAAVQQGLITCITVNHRAIDHHQQLWPVEERPAGLAGYAHVLPLLWKALVEDLSLPVEKLWRLLCWGPRQFLGQPPDTLAPGSDRWLLFSPNDPWILPRQVAERGGGNRPWPGRTVQGRVVASGLASGRWLAKPR